MPSLNLNEKCCAGTWPSKEVSFTNAVVSSLFSLITIPGNLLVLIVIYKNHNGKMRSPFNMLILNLAIADLLVGVIVEPLSVLIHIRKGLGCSLKYGDYQHHVYFTSFTASIFSLGMLTIDRHVALTSPMKYRATLGNNRAVIRSAGVWIVSCTLPFLGVELGCLWYFFVFANASVLLTFLVLVFAFVRVHLALRAQIRELDAMHGSSVVNQPRNNALKTEAKITKTFICMLIAFIFCYTPSLIMIYLMTLCTTCSCQSIHWFRDLSYIFIVLNSCINPYLYAWKLPNFKEAITFLFKKTPSAPVVCNKWSHAAHVCSFIRHEGRREADGVKRASKMSNGNTTTTTSVSSEGSKVILTVVREHDNSSNFNVNNVIPTENEL